MKKLEEHIVTLQLKSTDSNNSVIVKIKLQRNISRTKLKKKTTVLFFCPLVESVVYYSSPSPVTFPKRVHSVLKRLRSFLCKSPKLLLPRRPPGPQSPFCSFAEYFAVISNCITQLKKVFLHNFESSLDF